MGEKCYFFGSFDPIHLGHIKIAEEIKKQFNFKNIIFMPTPFPPHKKALCTNFFDRLKMLTLVFGEKNVSDIESTIEAPNYTYKTIEKIGKCNFILGYDQFLQIENWKKPNYLKEMLNFIVIPRLGAKEQDFAHLKEKGYNFKVVEFELVNISSTTIRKMVKNGENIDNLVDEKVKNYIYEKRLYS